MPVALTPLTPPAAPQPPRKLWTRAELAAFENAGLCEGQHLELVEGELINKRGKKQPHTYAVARMVRWLMGIFEGVYPEAPIDVAPEDNPTSEPEPGVVVLKPEFAGYRAEQPRPNEVALVVEIADSSFTFDRTVKAALTLAPESWSIGWRI